VGLWLYPPPGWFQWKLSEADTLMIATMTFAWHMVVDFVVLVIAYTLLRLTFNRYCAPSKWEVWDGVLTEACLRDAQLSIKSESHHLDTVQCSNNANNSNRPTALKQNTAGDNSTLYEIVSLSEDEVF